MITSIEPAVHPQGRYSIKETSDMLGIHRNTLYKYVRAGYIKPMFKRQRVMVNQPRVRFLGAEIIRFWHSFV